MNDAILLPTRSKYCELILRGIKEYEVRKRVPKLKTPFTVYLYDTQGTFDITLCSDLSTDSVRIADKGRGKVIAEFVCDHIKTITEGDTWRPNIVSQQTCLTKDELLRYVDFEHHGQLCLWHISQLKVYDTPRPLSDFVRECKGDCKTGRHICIKVKQHRKDIWSKCDRLLPLTKAPQSYCYVKELVWNS